MNKVDTYERQIYPLLERFHVDAERAHHGVIGMLHMIEKNPQLLFVFENLITGSGFQYTTDRLKTTVGGVNLANPLMLPAGYDKNGEAINALFGLGFGAVEVGTVPLNAQPGNPIPRVFRIKENDEKEEVNGILNRYGFNSDGAFRVAQNLKRYENRKGVLGVSIGMNKTVEAEHAPGAHRDAFAQVLEHGDFFTINVSSPNTEKLRDLQTHDHMKRIVTECQREMAQRGIVKPIFIKLAPDITKADLESILGLVTDMHLAGVMLTNTTVNSDIKARLGEQWKKQAGGVSGRPLQELSTQMIAYAHKTAPHVPIIGMGGIDGLDSALEKFRAGASAIGLLSALVFKGPSLPSTLLSQLDRWLEKEGKANISQLVGQKI